jgi:hypothetical protein
VVEGGTPRLMVECTWGDTEIDRGLRYLRARFPAAQAWQVSATGSKDYASAEGIRVARPCGCSGSSSGAQTPSAYNAARAWTSSAS